MINNTGSAAVWKQKGLNFCCHCNATSVAIDLLFFYSQNQWWLCHWKLSGIFRHFIIVFCHLLSLPWPCNVYMFVSSLRVYHISYHISYTSYFYHSRSAEEQVCSLETCLVLHFEKSCMTSVTAQLCVDQGHSDWVKHEIGFLSWY